MATVNRVRAAFEGGTCVWSYDYDNVTLKLLTYQCANDSPYASEGKVRTVSADGATFGPWFTQTVQPGQHFSIAVPVAVQNQFNIGVDARGRLTGVDEAYRMLGT